MTEEQLIRHSCISGAIAEEKEQHCIVSEVGLGASAEISVWIAWLSAFKLAMFTTKLPWLDSHYKGTLLAHVHTEDRMAQGFQDSHHRKTLSLLTSVPFQKP